MEADSETKELNAKKELRKQKMREEINKREGSDKNMELFKNINEKLQDKSFIEQAIESTTNKPLTTTITNEVRPLDQVRNHEDLFHADQSQHDRNTDTMGEFHKNWEDNYE